MIRPEQKLSLLSSAGEEYTEPGKNVNITNLLHDIMKENPEFTEELVQAVHNYVADKIYHSMRQGHLLVLFDAITFVPAQLGLVPEDFPPDDKTLLVQVDLVQPKIPGVDPGCLVMPDPDGRPM